MESVETPDGRVRRRAIFNDDHDDSDDDDDNSAIDDDSGVEDDGEFKAKSKATKKVVFSTNSLFL